MEICPFLFTKNRKTQPLPSDGLAKKLTFRIP